MAESYLHLEEKQKYLDPWTGRCVNSPKIQQFLRKLGRGEISRTFQVRFASVVAGAYYSYGESLAQPQGFMTAAHAKQLAGVATRLRCTISKCGDTAPILTEQFHSELDSLANDLRLNESMKKSAKGDPARRLFFVRAAELVYESFNELPVDIITDIASLGWPEIDGRTVRDVLTAAENAAIKRRCDESRKSRNGATVEASLALHKAYRAAKIGFSAADSDAKLIATALQSIRLLSNEKLKFDLEKILDPHEKILTEQ